jgi:hypothetical protein
LIIPVTFLVITGLLLLVRRQFDGRRAKKLQAPGATVSGGANVVDFGRFKNRDRSRG